MQPSTTNFKNPKLLVVAGVVIIFVAIATGIGSFRHRGWVTTSAAVTGSHRLTSRTDDKHASYDAYVRYTVNGTTTSSHYHTTAEPRVGSSVDITYNPDQPTQVSGDTPFSSAVVLFAGVPVGLILIGVGLVSGRRAGS